MKYVYEIFWWELMQATAMPSSQKKAFDIWLSVRSHQISELNQARSMATRFWSTMSVMVQSFPCHEDKTRLPLIHGYPSLSFIFLHRNLPGVRRRVHRWWVPNGQAQRSAWTSTWRSCETIHGNSILWLHETAAVGNWAGKKTASLEVSMENLCSWQQSVRGIRKTQWIHIIDIRLYYSWCIISLIASYCQLLQSRSI